MTYFLAKTDPDTYSIGRFAEEKQTVWDGVTNAQAVRALLEMRPGDRVFVYHTGAEKAVVGLALATSEAYPDPKQPAEGSLVVIDLVPLAALRSPVALSLLKADPGFETSPLVRQGRLSIVPLTAPQAARIEKLGAAR